MGTLKQLITRSSKIHAYYVLHFAGRPRATRQLPAMDMLVAEASEIASLAVEVSDEGSESFLERAQERFELYRKERIEILDAHAQGLDVARSYVLGTRASLLGFRYSRHFAGQDRRTRDISMMDELIADMESLQRRAAELLVAKEPPGLRSELERMTEALSIYRAERTAMLEAQLQGTPEEQAGRLARAANLQFEAYRLFFSGQSRVSRRPEHLARICSELERVSDAMAALSAKGQGGEQNLTNAGIVAERLVVYRTELEALEGVRSSSTALERLRSLDGCANALLSDYDEHFAGQDRASRDPERLGNMCDQLFEVERQLDALIQRFGLGLRHRLASRVRDMLVMFEREYQAIMKAKLN